MTAISVSIPCDFSLALCDFKSLAISWRFQITPIAILQFGHLCFRGQQRGGGEFYFILAVLRTLSPRSNPSLFDLKKTCIPMKGPPEAPLILSPGSQAQTIIAEKSLKRNPMGPCRTPAGSLGSKRPPEASMNCGLDHLLKEPLVGRFGLNQRRRDDNKNKICILTGSEKLQNKSCPNFSHVHSKSSLNLSKTFRALFLGEAESTENSP